MLALLPRDRLPFDFKSPVGYTVACALECVMCWTQFMISSCLASAGIVAFLLGLAVTKDLTNALCIIQKNIKIKRNRLKGVIKLYRFIELHSSVKELSFGMVLCSDFTSNQIERSIFFRTIYNFMDVYQPASAILLLWCIGTLCVALILLEMALVT